MTDSARHVRRGQEATSTLQAHSTRLIETADGAHDVPPPPMWLARVSAPQHTPNRAAYSTTHRSSDDGVVAPLHELSNRFAASPFHGDAEGLGDGFGCGHDVSLNQGSTMAGAQLTSEPWRGLSAVEALSSFTTSNVRHASNVSHSRAQRRWRVGVVAGCPLYHAARCQRSS